MGAVRSDTMSLIDPTNHGAFVRCVEDLIDTPQVQSMRTLPHHPGVNCFEHSIFVAYIAFRLARRWGLDYMACARAGLSSVSCLACFSALSLLTKSLA